MIYRSRLVGVHVASHGHGAHTDVRHPIKEPEVTKEQFDAIMEALAPIAELAKKQLAWMAAEEARVAAEAQKQAGNSQEPQQPSA